MKVPRGCRMSPKSSMSSTAGYENSSHSGPDRRGLELRPGAVRGAQAPAHCGSTGDSRKTLDTQPAVPARGVGECLAVRNDVSSRVDARALGRSRQGRREAVGYRASLSTRHHPSQPPRTCRPSMAGPCFDRGALVCTVLVEGRTRYTDRTRMDPVSKTGDGQLTFYHNHRYSEHGHVGLSRGQLWTKQKNDRQSQCTQCSVVYPRLQRASGPVCWPTMG